METEVERIKAEIRKAYMDIYKGRIVIWSKHPVSGYEVGTAIGVMDEERHHVYTAIEELGFEPCHGFPGRYKMPKRKAEWTLKDKLDMLRRPQGRPLSIAALKRNFAHGDDAQ